MEIKYDAINGVGIELFRKNNNSFISSNLSAIMERIFKAANSPHIREMENEYYMKSGAIPNRVFYIYSDQLAEKYEKKILDVVQLNGNMCIWIYSKNAINMIDKYPVKTIETIYDALLRTFEPSTLFGSFINTERFIVKLVMTLNLIIFLNETYGALDIEECKKNMIDTYLYEYTEESASLFIEDIVKNYSNTQYISAREYLDSYLLLEEKPKVIPV